MVAETAAGSASLSLSGAFRQADWLVAAIAACLVDHSARRREQPTDGTDDGAVFAWRNDNAGCRMRRKRHVGSAHRPARGANQWPTTRRGYCVVAAGVAVFGNFMPDWPGHPHAAAADSDHGRHCIAAFDHHLPACQARDLVATGGSGTDLLLGCSARLGGSDRSMANPEIWLIYAGSVAWVFGYDTIYAVQDMADDRIAGVKSSALGLGDRLNLGVRIAFCVAILLISAGIQAHQGPGSGCSVSC